MNSKNNKYRLITRADFDGLVSTMLLESLGLVKEIILTHPKDIQLGTFVPKETDILVNLPYHRDAHLVFDHHISEMLRASNRRPNHIINPGFSSARIIYNYFGGAKAFPLFPEQLLVSSDDFAYARFTMEDILHPKDWVLLNFLLDHRTRLDLLKGFKLTHEKFFLNLKDVVMHTPIREIMNLFYVKDRANTYFNHQEEFKAQLKRCSKVIEYVSVVNYLDEEDVFIGNRFMIYAMYPKSEISLTVTKGKDGKTVTFSCGKSVINRGNPVNIGEVMRRYNGGGHSNAGACRVDIEFASQVEDELIKQLLEDGY